jgi:hypothetical protein
MFYNRWDEDPDRNYCVNSLMECYIFSIDYAFKNDAGFVDSLRNDTLGWRLIFDFLYILLMIVFVTQIIAGLIIDTFA